jgi:uncharacterized delta-60 repeat protein
VRKSTRPLFHLEQFESRIAPAVGSLDMSFGVGGIAQANVGFAGFDDARAVARQEDGKVLIAGQSVGMGGGFSTDFAVARYNPDGSLDTTFGTGGKAVISFGEGGEGTGATAIALEPAALGGRIILAGTAGDFPDLNFAAVRLNPDGSLDTTFDGDGRVMIDISGGSDDRASGVGVLSDGRIAIGGSTGSFSDRDFAAVLLNPDGSLDTSFAGDGKFAVDISGAGSNDESIGLVVQSNDFVVLAGTSGKDFAAIRLKTDGSLDSGFDADGKVTVNVNTNVIGDSTDEAFSLALQPDGKILIAGRAFTGFDSNGSAAVVRLGTDGKLDATFDTDGKFVQDLDGGRETLGGIAVQADGKILVAGDQGRDFLVFRLTSTGALDATYGTGGKVLVDVIGNDVSERIGGLVIQPDGLAVITGTGGADFAAIRLDADGKLDPGFDGDGKVVTNLSDQSFDSTRDMALQADGKVVVVGTTEDGDNRNFGAVRFNADGTVDTTFGTGGRVVIDFGGMGNLGREDIANAVAIQDDGKIIIGGSTRSVTGNPIFAAVRLNPDGGLDTTFDTDGKAAVDLVDPGSADEVIAILIQPDGKIVLIGEGPSATNNDEDFAAARLNPDGSLDTTFGTGGKVSVEVTANDQRDSPRAAALQADGKIVIVGQTFNGTFSIFDIAAVRLNPDGTLDTTFAGDGKLDFDVTGTNQRDNASAVIALPDGRIVIAGSTSDSTGSDIALIGLNADGSFDPSFDGDGNRLIDLGGNDSANAAVRQADGKIVVVGSTSDGDESDTAVVRINADGSFDTTFGAGGKAILSLGPTSDSGRAVAIDADGRIVVAASIDESDFVAARLLVTDTSSNEFGQFAVGRSAGSGVATLFNSDQSVAFTVNAFPGFTGGVRTAVGDFNGDGVADLVVGNGPGGPTQVRIFDGKTQAELFSVAPFEASFLGGVYVAAGDLTGDGRAELVVTPDEGGGPRIRVFDGNGFAPIADFFGIDDPNFRGGARAALADISGDGVVDLIVAAGFGGGPRVAVFDGTTVVGTTGDPQRLFNDIFVFEPTLRNGVFITGGDFDGDGFADLAAGGGPDGGPRVLILSGADLQAGNLASPKVLGNFFAGDVDNRGGIRLAAKDLDGDNRADLVVGDGTGAGSRVTGYLGSNITAASTPPEAFAFDAFPGVNDGVFVG